MTRLGVLGVLALLALVTACGAPGPTAVETAVREYVALRNAGDLRGLLGKSCGGLYSSTENLLAQPRIGATLTGYAQTADGRRTAVQHGEVRRYQDGWRVCALHS